ncbi:MAG: thioredoxin family protein [Ferruginibacter sp.]
MKKIIVFLISGLLIFDISAQETKLYNPAADAENDISSAIQKAKAEHKFVLIQAGGNWCSWCIEFARFAKADPQIDSVINAGFIWYHLNYSKENRNEILLAKYGYPQRFGFPVFLILNDKGERLHTQSSEYLEDGKKSYDKSKVREFLQNWSPAALDPVKYQKKG